MLLYTVHVDIGSIGMIVDHISLGSQCIKYRLGDLRRRTIGTVQTHLLILKGTGGQGNQIAQITVSAQHIVGGPSDLLSVRQWQVSSG